MKLDDFLRDRPTPIDFIKIDVEGSESDVLNGAIEILRDDKPTIYIELCKDYPVSWRWQFRCSGTADTSFCRSRIS